MSDKAVGTIQGGGIRLDKPLNLPDATRVELTVKPIDRKQGGWDDFIDELEQLGREQPIGSGGIRYSRDDLHERR